MSDNKFSISKIKLFIISLFNLSSILINCIFSVKLINLLPPKQMPYIVKNSIIFINKYPYLILILPILYWIINIGYGKNIIEKLAFILLLSISILILLINLIAPIIYLFPFH